MKELEKTNMIKFFKIEQQAVNDGIEFYKHMLEHEQQVPANKFKTRIEGELKYFQKQLKRYTAEQIVILNEYDYENTIQELDKFLQEIKSKS